MNERSEQKATAPVASTALLAGLGDVQAARLTAEKSETVQKRDGYQITGFVLCHPETGARCIVEMSACRWLSKEESWWLMHESESPIHSANTHLPHTHMNNCDVTAKGMLGAALLGGLLAGALVSLSFILHHIQ